MQIGFSIADLVGSCVQLQVLYGVNQRLRTEDVDSPLCNIRPVKTVCSWSPLDAAVLQSAGHSAG
jgi:hypothetical protein